MEAGLALTNRIEEAAFSSNGNIMSVLANSFTNSLSGNKRKLSAEVVDDQPVLRINSVALETIVVIGLIFALAYLAVVCLMGIQTPTAWASHQLDVGNDA